MEEYRSVPFQMEERSSSRGRRLCGIVVPYGVNQVIDDVLTERFERGAFRHQSRAANRVGLFHNHSNQGGTQMGHGLELREDPAGLYGEFHVVHSEKADHFLALVREGSLREWSIGFRPEQHRMDGRVTVRTRASVFETALVPEGAYGELASVGEVRAAIPVLTRDTLLARLPKPRFPA